MAQGVGRPARKHASLTASVVGAIVPWNYPLLMAAWKFTPALAAGCHVVLKPSEYSPSSALEFAALAEKAGLPAGVLSVLPGYVSAARDARPRGN